MEIKEINIHGYERVIHGVDDLSGLDCIIAVHNTKLGQHLVDVECGIMIIL